MINKMNNILVPPNLQYGGKAKATLCGSVWTHSHCYCRPALSPAGPIRYIGMKPVLSENEPAMITQHLDAKDSKIFQRSQQFY